MQGPTLNKNIAKALVRRLSLIKYAVKQPESLALYSKATETGLFDVDYYQDKYGKFINNYAAFVDYLSKSHCANINPSSHFDTEHYLRANLDVYHAGGGALAHYLKYGAAEKRPKSSAIERWHPTTELIPEDSDSWRQQKVAVCLHIFYDDFIDRFARCIKDFPVGVDVYLAVKDKKMQAKADKVFSKLEVVNKVTCAIAPNRGRNFGPMLVEFSDALLEYDLLIHCHSKKSLYCGREQFQWSDYLNEFLLKNRHVVANTLRLFDQQEQLGMYYPTSFWMMPSWVNNWTCNKAFAQEFVNDWDLDISESFLAYPVGGMFWARPKALKQWLQKQYKYEDFPAEPLPADGSSLHAMERILGVLAEKNGYEQLFYYPQSGQFTTDKSYIYNQYHKNAYVLGCELFNFDIISFDIFDTLLRRQYFEPDYAKLKLGKVLAEKGAFESAQDFVKQRNKAEFEVRKQKDFKGDVNIYETYDKLAQMLSWSAEQARQYADMEFEFDLAMIQPKDELLEIANELALHGKQIWLISDTYYSEEQIRLMLKKIGLAANFELFVSSELGLRKDTGTMWEMVADKVKKAKLSYIHLGDNVRSDAQLCGDYGLPNMHILNPYDKWLLAGFEPALKSELDEQNIQKWGALISAFGRYPYFGE